VQYVLKKAGIEDVPRQSDQQYVWLRRNTQIFPVMSDRLSSFEFDDLRPGDLLFWSGTYTPAQEREFQVTHSMIYLGRRKKDGKPLMAGASSGRAYDGVPRHGSSVFDFLIPRRATAREARPSSQFVGYGPIPGLWQVGERETIPRIR
jgi:cell wall-associated NlpC family hydrolase